MPKILPVSNVVGTAMDRTMTVTLLTDGLQIQRNGGAPVLWSMTELDKMYSNALYRNEPVKEAKAIVAPATPKVKTLPYGLTVAIHHSYTTRAKKELTSGWRTRPIAPLGLAILMAEATGAKTCMCQNSAVKWLKEAAAASGGFAMSSPGRGRDWSLSQNEAEIVVDYYKQRLEAASRSRSAVGKKYLHLAIAAKKKHRANAGAPEILVDAS